MLFQQFKVVLIIKTKRIVPGHRDTNFFFLGTYFFYAWLGQIYFRQRTQQLIQVDVFFDDIGQ